MCLYFSVDDLLKAGINKASHLVIVNRSSNQAREVVLTDADTIVTVQSIFKWVVVKTLHQSTHRSHVNNNQLPSSLLSPVLSGWQSEHYEGNQWLLSTCFDCSWLILQVIPKHQYFDWNFTNLQHQIHAVSATWWILQENSPTGEGL